MTDHPVVPAKAGIRSYLESTWQSDVLPTLAEYVAIPCRSVDFDPNWEELGHMDKALNLFVSWAKSRNIAGLKLEVHRLPNLTPVILIDIAPTSESATGTVLLYGHLDKQPEMAGWRDGFGPWIPVFENNRLYGRGSADDGYAMFTALTAIESLQNAGMPHARCLILIEASEESGSPHLPAYIEALDKQIGSPELIICLDSGAENYDQWWTTSSLRGIFDGILTVRMLTEGVHSGFAGGNVPSTFRILRTLLDRIEDSETGDILLPELWTEIPPERLAEVPEFAKTLHDVSARYPLVPGAHPKTDDPVETVLSETWRPSMSVTGADGLPATADAGNVLRPFTTVKLSFRLPPTCDPQNAALAVQKALEASPPYGAEVTFKIGALGSGWNAPATAPWLASAIQEASTEAFGKPANSLGEGGSIPFMSMLGEKFPDAQFVVTGVLGPESNAHGPNEFLDIPTVLKVTECVARVVGAHAQK